MENNYDVAIIGGGPGGYVAGIRAGQLGLKAAVVEKEVLGGVCLNWGCIPSKSLLRNAEILSYIQRAQDFGIQIDGYTADYSVAVKRSRRVVARSTRGVGFLLRKNNVEHIEGSATLRGNGRATRRPARAGGLHLPADRTGDGTNGALTMPPFSNKTTLLWIGYFAVALKRTKTPRSRLCQQRTQDARC